MTGLLAAQPPKWSQPRGCCGTPSRATPLPVRVDADRPEPLRHRRTGREASPAASAPRRRRARSPGQLGAQHRREPRDVPLQGRGGQVQATPLAEATREASRSRPSERSTIAVAPASAATGPSASGGRGRRCTATASGSAPGRPGIEQVQPGPGQPERTGHGHDVTGAGARPQHRGAAVERAQRRHGDHQDPFRRGGQVAADHRARSPSRARARGRAPRPPRSTSTSPGSPAARPAERPWQPRRRGSGRRPWRRRPAPSTSRRRKSRPATTASVVATSPPTGRASTAASSRGRLDVGGSPAAARSGKTGEELVLADVAHPVLRPSVDRAGAR